MPRDSGGLSSFGGTLPSALGSGASLAPPPPFFGDASVFSTEWMPISAMSDLISRSFLALFNLPLVLVRKSERKRFFAGYFSKREPSRHPFFNGVVLKAKIFSELRKKMTFPFYGYINGAAPIPLLLFSRSPSAVFRRIVTIVINSINSHAFRFRRHVCLKRGIIVKPAITNFDAPTSIISELPEVGVVAPTFHSLPNRVKRGWVFKWHNKNLCCEVLY